MFPRDRRIIFNLHFLYRYIPASIARLYGLSQARISVILNEDRQKNITVNPEYTCMACGAEDAIIFYIDGNEENKNPQNIIMLCEPDKRRFERLRARRS